MQDFKDWLMTHKNLKLESASDVISRLNRAIKITATNYETISIESLTNENIDDLSVYVKSQLKRSVVLWREYN